MKIIKGLAVIGMIGILGACGANKSSSLNSTGSIELDNQIVKSVEGCYEVLKTEIKETAYPGHQAIVSPLAAKTLCLEDTAVNGAVSRSGRVSVTAKNSRAETVGGIWGFEVSEAQPRCPGCYILSGQDGVLVWNAEDRVFNNDPSAPIIVTLDIRGLKTKYEMSLGQIIK